MAREDSLGLTVHYRVAKDQYDTSRLAACELGLDEADLLSLKAKARRGPVEVWVAVDDAGNRWRAWAHNAPFAEAIDERELLHYGEAAHRHGAVQGALKSWLRPRVAP